MLKAFGSLCPLCKLSVLSNPKKLELNMVPTDTMNHNVHKGIIGHDVAVSSVKSIYI